MPPDDALVDGTLSGFVLLLILGWWRSWRGVSLTPVSSRLGSADATRLG